MPPSDESSPSSPFMNELINIFYLQKYFFLVNCVFCFTPFCIFKYLIPKPTVLTKQNKVLTSLCKKEGKKNKQKQKRKFMVHFMAFICKTGSIDRCLELSATAAALVAFAGLLVWLSVQLKVIPPRTCLAFIFLSVFFFFINSPFECVCQRRLEAF